MDVQQKLDEIAAAVENARSMPMSASCVVNRAELLALLEEAREALPGTLAQAQELLGGREQVVAEAQREAQRIIESAEAERNSLVSGTELVRRSQEEAEHILSRARREAEEIRAEADDYVDSKLANFEVVLSKTIGSVDRGREKLLGRGEGADSAPERPADPAELRERADAYVEAQFQAFQAVLAKTLEAVGRGRQKLAGHRPADELAAHLAARDGERDAHGQVQADDADYLAGLAEQQDRQEPALSAPSAPSAPSAYGPQPAASADPYAYQHAGQPEQPQEMPQDAYAYQQGQVPAQQDYRQDPYASYQQGYQQDPYAYQQAYQYAAGRPQQLQEMPQDAYAYQQGQVPVQQDYRSQPEALDETSFFDTGLIDVEQLRQYGQGR